jgi:hypothetical protein
MKFDAWLLKYPYVKIVKNKLIINTNVEIGSILGEIEFQHDDRDRTYIYEKKKIEFLLPINHQLSIEFSDDFTITYKQIDDIKYFFKIDACFKNDLLNFEWGMNVFPTPWKGNEKFDIKDYSENT